MIATHVTIWPEGAEALKHTYRLGATSCRGQQIECIAPDGLVHRVCHWQPTGYDVGTMLYTNGQNHHYHAGGSP